MSLDKLEAVPVDTHVWQIAKRDYQYATGNGQKSITDRLYTDIGECSKTCLVIYADGNCEQQLMLFLNY